MNKEVYQYLLHTYGRNIWQWVGFVTEIFRVLVMRVYGVFLMAQVTSDVASGNFDLAKRHTLYFLISYIVGAFIGTCGELLSLHTENIEYGKLMMSYYKKLVGKDLSFYRDNQTGYLTSIFRQHLDGAMMLLRFLRGEALGTFISMVMPPLVLFIASPLVGMVAISVVIIQFIYVTWLSSKANKYRRMTHEIYSKITGEVSDIITNIVAFKSSGAEEQASGRMAEYIVQETKAFELRRNTVALLDFPRNIMTACGISFAIYCIILTSAGINPQSLGLIVLTLTYMFQIVRNVSSLPELIANHDDLVTKVYPTLKYLSKDYEEINDPKKPVDFVVKKGSISINKLNFSYTSHSNNEIKIPVFKDLSIQINGSEQIGVVGLSGAGKSTLANLLLRFDEIESGSIKVDGIDIRDVKQSELRKKIAYVPQEPLLFHRSIRENISYYNSNISDEEIILAATAAHAHEFIVKLPDGYDTTVGERGIKLSGGQKQRVAIARAILKKAPIMIFDEATSALDSESERIIQKALPEIIGKQTAIVVAHRLSTVAGLDRIIVMHEGSIVEMGTHDELLKLGGRYYSLWQKQTSEFVD